MSVVTKTGDGGITGLFGSGRVPKTSPRIEAYGTVDELNAILGIVLAEPNLDARLSEQLLRTQRLLFHVGADLATPDFENKYIQRVIQPDIEEIEKWIYALESSLPLQTHFILPSGSRGGALLHHARTVTRRAERRVCKLMEQETINTLVQIYLNRLSDYLFLAAREANRQAGAEEIPV